MEDKVSEPEKKFDINFKKSKTNFCLDLHKNDDKYYNKTQIYEFIVLDKMRLHKFSLGSVTKGFAKDKIKTITLNGSINEFSIKYRSIDIKHIVHIRKYLVKNIIQNDNQILRSLYFVLLSAGMSLYIQNTKYVSLNKGTVFGKTNVYQFKSYRIALPFIVASLDRCVGSCNKFYKVFDMKNK